MFKQASSNFWDKITFTHNVDMARIRFLSHRMTSLVGSFFSSNSARFQIVPPGVMQDTFPLTGRNSISIPLCTQLGQYSPED